MPVKRITWIVWRYPSDASFGGSFFKTTCEALADRHYAVDVVAGIPEFPLEPIRSMTRSRWQMPPSIRSPLDNSNEPVRIWRPRYFGYPGHTRIGFPGILLARAAEGVLEPSSLVHSHGVHPTATAGRHLARRWGVPLVVTLHGSDVNVFATRSVLSLSVFRRVVASADLVIAVSNDLAEKTERLTGRRPAVQAMGVPLNLFTAGDKQRARKALGLEDDRFVCIYVGNLEPSKGIRALIEASMRSELSDVQIVVVGDGSMRGAVQQARGIRYLGSLAPAGVAEAMRASDALVLPSHREGLPTVLCEAGAIRLPVIASAVGGVSELLSQGRGTTLDAITPARIAEGILRVKSDPADAERMALRLSRHVKKYYSLDSAVDWLDDQYALAMRIT